MRKTILIILVTILIYSCNKSQNVEINSSLENEKTLQKGKDMELQYVNYELVKSLSPREAIDHYKPIFTDDFILSDRETEFRIGLYNKIPKEQWNSNIKIREITWETSKTQNLTIWYEEKDNKWVPINHFIWDKDSEF